MLTDPADQSVSVRSQAVDGRLEVVDLATDAAQAQLVCHRGGRSGLVVGPDEAREFDPAPPSGGRSMTISVRESGMPMTVSMNSPSTNVRPSTSRPILAKNAVTESRSATVIPMWSNCLMCDMRSLGGAGGWSAVISGPRRRSWTLV
jgi:hypothetical protein